MPNISGQNAARLPGILAMSLPDDVASRLQRMGVPSDVASASSSLKALTSAVRAGDAAAFARFYDAYAFGIYRHVLVIFRGDELAAREVFQSVAIKLARKMEVFESENTLQAWLRRVTRNAFIDYCRTQKRAARFVSLAESPAHPADAGSAGRLHEMLQATLAECPNEDRELLNAFYVDGRPLAELAEQSGQTYKALESHLGRLRQKIRAKLLNQLRHEN